MSNLLKNETSPYLLQHAENPVHWYPWGEEAFQKAKKEDKPIFLSIGYSTCHWCHVMAHESFEDEKTAELLNRHFVSIKVDREERPDIDSVYMSVCQAFTGSGGWPMTIFMTWDKKPFFASYRGGRRSECGFLDDYAFYIAALTELYRATFETEYLERAARLCKEAEQRFADKEKGGYYLCEKESTELFVNPKETYDGAIPSGNL